MKKILSFVVALALVALCADAQPVARRNANFAYLYDVDSTNLTYCVMGGQGGDPFGPAIVGIARIKTTSGPTATVEEFTTGGAPFTSISVGDTILVTDSAGAAQQLVVVARASAASITVNTTVTLEATAGHNFTWMKQTCGTAITNGWIRVSDARAVSMTVQYEQGDLGSLRVRWECKGLGIGAQPVVVYPGEASDCGIGGTLSTDRCDFTTAGVTARLTVSVFPNPFAYCRVGLAYAASDAAENATNLEQITALLVKEQ